MNPDPEIAAFFERVDEELNALRASRRSSDAMTEQLRERFERCAVQALRRPDPLQRSLLLRAIVRAVVPGSLRAMLKRALASVRARGPK
ncbi:MAG TPA: hypothetical protein VMU99_04405 [Acidimicrobiales bacterium]|nr:hypothetical protein [Acidimicrobiales bacterium]